MIIWAISYQSHCWLTKLALALVFWPVSTSSAPHSVLEIAIANAVTVSAGIIAEVVSVIATPTKATIAAMFASTR